MGVLLLAPAARAEGASFNCQAARLPAERLVCSDAALGDEDVRMNYLHHAVRDKLADARSREQLRHDQLRWLSRVRNRCTDLPCLRQAYAARIETLAERNNRVVSLVGQPYEPLYRKEFATLYDSAVARGIRLRAEQPTTYQFEFQLDPRDEHAWSGIGPRVDLVCAEASALEGYANAAELQRPRYFMDFTPIDRGQGRAYIVHTLTLGRDLPLKTDIDCALGFSEWYLDQPSTLVMVRP
jgi:uncharacterized protein